MPEIKLRTTIVYEKILQEYQGKEHRIVILEGGTGSSKSVSLAQLFMTIMINEKNTQLTITRKTFPALRATAMRDFLNVLKETGIYREELHDKSQHIFRYPPTGSEVDFISIDEPTKVRSRRRNYLWMNEANEFSLEDYRQLSLRTDKQIFMDYNPSHQFHWIYEDLQTRKDCVVLPSTYKDNPFLSPDLIKEIESYQNKDKNYWRIYGLGLKGITESNIYTHWQYCEGLPESYDNLSYGLDFGYNCATAFIKIVEKDKEYWWDEMLYQSHLTNEELIKKFEELNISKTDRIYADSAEPARIAAIRNAGFNIYPANKEVKAGMDFVKSHKLFITKRSLNILREIKSYSWKEKDGKLLDEPIKTNDHAMDAGRYGEYFLLGERMPRITIFTLGGPDEDEE